MSYYGRNLLAVLGSIYGIPLPYSIISNTGKSISFVRCSSVKYGNNISVSDYTNSNN